MQKSLYFVCPTDAMECIINHSSNSENYFYTSLGNAIQLNDKVIDSLKDLIVNKSISEVLIVISNDNRIIQDAIGNKEFSQIKGLNEIYESIEIQRNFKNVFWQSSYCQDSLLNGYLRSKIKEIQEILDKSGLNPIKVSGKIYDKGESVFTDVKHVFPHDFFSLN
ncbi:conserved hypothetical protein [Tenacibaculum sp. 190524A05c]